MKAQEPAATTVVHLLRHGQVYNPDHILYGRLPGFGLSGLGQRMAQRVADHLSRTELTHLRCSPLLRAQETMAPIAASRPQLEVVTDQRVVEAANHFEGQVFGPKLAALRNPSAWPHLVNPLKPSWGEPYVEIAARMRAALREAAQAAGPGGQALIVSHELPIWMARRSVTGRSLVHDPRRRQCRLASLTSFSLVDGVVVAVDYFEPAGDLAELAATGYCPAP
ncbi:MAG: histidine phosphatase family protein [Propionibacteriaceae bacterium]|jgi:broad specificity phosphatase PhoE|nr:histidine phosphatase family protein [Propionibacteriaceae bacterium]